MLIHQPPLIDENPGYSQYFGWRVKEEDLINQLLSPGGILNYNQW